MATFNIDDFTQDTVTVTASGLISGSIICFLIYLTGDKSAVIVKEEYTATGDSITETFKGLDPFTDYTLNVHDGTDWLGAVDFTTEAEPVVNANGRLLNIPVLSSNYPLFDWDDWPGSYAALVPDGLTSEFEKECWNAIVDKLAGAFETAGIPWSSTYTTHEGARITEEYGDLYAKMLNSLRHNINRPAPLGGWKWACDPSFRGYIGREDFRGVDAYGENGADDVYPEYFKEMVRKLNLLLEIMRCNGHINLIQTGEVIDTMAYNRAIRVGRSVQFGCFGNSFAWHHNKAIQVGKAAVIIVDPYSTYTLSLQDFHAGVGGRLIVNPHGTTTRSLYIVHRGIPKYLKTDKGLIATYEFANLLRGFSAKVEYAGNSLTVPKVAPRAGEGQRVTGGGVILHPVSFTPFSEAGRQISAHSLINDSEILVVMNGTVAPVSAFNRVVDSEFVTLYSIPGLRVKGYNAIVDSALLTVLGGTGISVAGANTIFDTTLTYALNGTGIQTGGINFIIDCSIAKTIGGTGGLVVGSNNIRDVSLLNVIKAPSAPLSFRNIILDSCTLLPIGGPGAPISGRNASFITNSGTVRGAEGLQIDGAVAETITDSDSLVRLAPHKQIQGRGFSDTGTPGAQLLQGASALVQGESSSYTNTKQAKVVKKESAPLQGCGRSETDTSESRIREQRSIQVQADCKSSTENARGVLRAAGVSKFSAHGLSAVKYQSGIAVGTPIGQMSHSSNTSERAAADSTPGLAPAAYAKVKSKSTKISFSASTNMECQFTPAIVKISHARLNMTAMGEHATVSVFPQDVSSAYKTPNAMVRMAGVVELDAYDVGTKEVKPQIVAGKTGLAQPVVPSVSLRYRQPEIITGFPMDADIVPDKFPIAERCSADQVSGTEFAGRGRTGMKSRVSLDLGQLEYLSGSGTARTGTSATVDFFASAAAQSVSVSKTPCSVVLGTAWLSPVWEDGGLWIRQVHQNATWLEDGLFILEFSGIATWLEDGLLILNDCFSTVSEKNVLEVM